MCDTWCNIAYVHEKAGHSYEEIKDAYVKALAYAEQSEKPQSVVGLCVDCLLLEFIKQATKTNMSMQKLVHV